MKTRLKFRKGVCGIIRGPDARLLLGERAKDRGRWQLPQGGIDRDESALEALHREMEEEVGVQPLPILGQTQEFMAYEWPSHLALDSKYAGQKHLYFYLDGSQIDITKLVATPEFARFEWCTLAETLGRIVEWKRPVYERAFKELGLLK